MRMRSLSLLLCLILLLPLKSHAAEPMAIPTVSASGAVLIEAESGRILYEKQAHTPRGMASTTKIMTAILAIEACDDPDQIVTVSPDAVGIEGSSVYLYAGERITMRHLIYALMLASANDAAAAIAVAIDGSISAFADRMNEKAAELGLNQTHFENPHGLDANGHQTTPYELALLTAYAMKNEAFRSIVSTKSITIPLHDGSTSRLLTNHHRLLRTDERIKGVKTGYTKACGRCLVSAAEKDGVKLIAVTLDAPNDWKDHTALIDYGLGACTRVTLAQVGSLSAVMPVVGGMEESVKISNATPLSLTLARDHGTPSVEYRVNCFLYAPVQRGQLCGEAIFYLDEKAIATLPLYAEHKVEQREEARSLWQRLIDWLASLF